MNIGNIIRRSWQLMLANFGPLCGGVWLAFIAGSLCFVLLGPLSIGIASATLIAARGGRPDVGEVFSGFTRFADGILASIIIAVLTSLGSLLCLIPGLIASVGLMYTYSFMADGYSLSDALAKSWELVKPRFFSHLGLIIVLGLVNALGALACGLGTIVTAPLTVIAITVAYHELTGAPAVENQTGYYGRSW